MAPAGHTVEDTILSLAAKDDVAGLKDLIGSGKASLWQCHEWSDWSRAQSTKGDSPAASLAALPAQRTPLMVACYCGSVQAVSFILSSGNYRACDPPDPLDRHNVNFRSPSDGHTALHCAASGMSVHAPQAVSALLHYGAVPGLADFSGKLPVDVLRACTDVPGVKSLLTRLLSPSSETLLPQLVGFRRCPVFAACTSPDPSSSSSSSSPPRCASPEHVLPATSPSSPTSSCSSSSSSSDSEKKRPSPGDQGEWHGLSPCLSSTSDEFRMYCFKVLPCLRPHAHDWPDCPFLHPGENARRRDPRVHSYSCVPCPDFRKGACKKGDECDFSHGVFESWLHPAQYRTRMCKDGEGCVRRVCFFAHSKEELRAVPSEYGEGLTPLDECGTPLATPREFVQGLISPEAAYGAPQATQCLLSIGDREGTKGEGTSPRACGAPLVAQTLCRNKFSPGATSDLSLTSPASVLVCGKSTPSTCSPSTPPTDALEVSPSCFRLSPVKCDTNRPVQQQQEQLHQWKVQQEQQQQEKQQQQQQVVQQPEGNLVQLVSGSSSDVALKQGVSVHGIPFSPEETRKLPPGVRCDLKLALPVAAAEAEQSTPAALSEPPSTPSSGLDPASDFFRMYCFKIRPCSRAYSHDWTECPFLHPGENARRRDPRKFTYSSVPCPEFKQGGCPREDLCPYAHGVFECWLHPKHYRTRMCKHGVSCSRRICFFAHSLEELRRKDSEVTNLAGVGTRTPGTPGGGSHTRSSSAAALASPGKKEGFAVGDMFAISASPNVPPPSPATLRILNHQGSCRLPPYPDLAVGALSPRSPGLVSFSLSAAAAGGCSPCKAGRLTQIRTKLFSPECSIPEKSEFQMVKGERVTKKGDAFAGPNIGDTARDCEGHQQRREAVKERQVQKCEQQVQEQEWKKRGESEKQQQQHLLAQQQLLAAQQQLLTQQLLPLTQMQLAASIAAASSTWTPAQRQLLSALLSNAAAAGEGRPLLPALSGQLSAPLAALPHSPSPPLSGGSTLACHQSIPRPANLSPLVLPRSESQDTPGFLPLPASSPVPDGLKFAGEVVARLSDSYPELPDDITPWDSPKDGGGTGKLLDVGHGDSSFTGGDGKAPSSAQPFSGYYRSAGTT